MINTKHNFKKKHILFFIFLCFLIYLSNYYFSFIGYWYSDHRLFETLHNVNLNKKIFEVLINSMNINGISWQFINPKLNLLSNLNFNLENYIFQQLDKS